MISDTTLAVARSKFGYSRAETRAAQGVLLERAATLLRTHCPNGEGAPEHSEQSAQWTACGHCEECRIAEALESVLAAHR